MKFTLFLGAGASVPLGFPDTRGFKESLEKSLDPVQDILMLSMLQKSGYDDIENILTDIEAIVDLPSSQGYHLLKNTMKVTYEPAQGNNFDSMPFDDMVKDFSTYKKKIQDYVYKAYSWNGLSQENLKIYDSVFDILKKSDDGIHICSTNYDQVMERYIGADNNKLASVDGFDFDFATKKSFFKPDVFSNTLQHDNLHTPCYLYKLHGSLNWVPDGDKIQRREENENSHEDNFVIYPTLLSKNKKYYNKPYVNLFEKFDERIDKTDIFIIIGYSFRDNYINIRFKNFLNRNNTKMFVISPSAAVDTVKELGSRFSYSNIDFRNPTHSTWIRRYHKLRRNLHREISADIHDDIFSRHLDKFFRILDVPYDAKVYNLVAKLEEIVASDMFSIIPLITSRKN